MELSIEQQEKLCKDVAEIKSAIIGNPDFKQRGLSGDVEDLKVFRDSVNNKMVWLAGALAASWFFVGIIGYFAKEWLKTKLGLKD